MANATASVVPVQLSAAPGSTVIADLHIRNDGPAEVRFRVDVAGDAASWVSVAPFAISVPPGEEGTARIFFRPPRSPAVRAGHHAVSIRIRADGDRKQELDAIGKVDIAPFAEVSVALDSDEALHGRRGTRRLTIDNRGNALLRATVTGVDPTGALAVTADPSSAEVEPGGAVTVLVETRAIRRRFGSAGDLPFTVVVEPQGGDPIRVEASIRQEPIVSRRVLAGVAAIVVVALSGALLRAVVFQSPRRSAAGVASAPSNCPGAGHLAHDANGQIRHDVVQPDNFSFLFLAQGGCFPVRWNPCTPVHYVINGEGAAAAQLADTRQAVADAAQATGIDFVFDGPTTESPRDRRNPYEPSLYGDRWAPVLIDWTHLGGADSLTETAGGGIPSEVGGVDVSGVVVLNLDAHLANNAPVPPGFGSGVTWGRIVLHELGHVLGLGHVTGVDQIMHDPVTDQTSPTSAYGFGDLAGLRLLGKAAGCLTTPGPGSGP